MNGNDRLSVAVVIDRGKQQAHFPLSNTVRVVIVGLYLIGRDPTNAIDRHILQWRQFVQAGPDDFDSFEPGVGREGVKGFPDR